VSEPVRIEGIPEILRNNKRFMEALKAEIERLLARAALETENRAKERAPVAFGRLRAGIHTERPGQFTTDVVSGEKYAAAVEYGTSPHFPPISELQLWAGRVLGDEDAAYPVARKIAVSGTQPQPYLRPAFEEVAPQLRSALEELAREVSGK